MAKISARGAQELARAITTHSIFLLRSDGVILTKSRNIPRDYWRIFCRFKGTPEEFRQKIAIMQEVEEWQKKAEEFLKAYRANK